MKVKIEAQEVDLNTFNGRLRYVVSGGKLRRTSWPKGKHLYVDGDSLWTHTIDESSIRNEGQWFALHGQYVDWEAYVEPRKVTKWLRVENANGYVREVFDSEEAALERCGSWQSVVKVTYELPPE